MRTLCEKCSKDMGGEAGHTALRSCPDASYPGHAAFQCRDCGERWLRHAGMRSRFSWTRYDLQFSGGPGLALATVARVPPPDRAF